jgi:Flp pilus assembly protein TadG
MTRRDRGQAAVEAALVLPFMMAVVLGVVQVAVVAAEQLAVWHAAREGARAAAVAAAPTDAATAAARAATGLAPLDVSVVVAGGLVGVTVTHTDPTDVPLIGALVPTVTLRATVRMALEP